MISVTVDHSRFDHAIDGILAAVGKDAVTVLVDEHRALVKTIVNFTPPPIGRGSPLKLGEDAASRDIHKLANEATPALIDTTSSRYGLTQVDRWITGKDGDKIELIWDTIDWDGTKLPQLHQQYRNAQGRIPSLRQSKGKWRTRVIVPTGTLDPYIKLIKERVGRFKAKFAFSAWRLGASFPNYISRHFGSLGDGAIAQYDLGAANPSITFGARNPGINRLRSSLSNAFKLRATAMTNRMKLIASGYSKDVAAGIRPKAHAADTRVSDEEEVG